ncbi:MAG: hypothetical protein D3909_13665 [Candidatus Electrothrix sp. ATG1]|nr:hypothetical protein [Candidatus Electrothrix sp. ATG1]
MSDLKTEDIAYMALRLMSLVIIIVGINKIPDVIYSIYYYRMSIEQIGGMNLIMISLPPISLFIAAFCCWILTPKLSKALVKESKSATLSFSLLGFQKVMFSVMGVYVLSLSLPNLVNTTMIYFNVGRKSAEGSVPVLVGLMVLSVQLIMGLTLLFGAEGLTNFLNRNEQIGGDQD